MNIPTAKEARLLTLTSSDVILKKIFLAINNSLNEGLYSASIETTGMDKDSIEEISVLLRKKGYKVERNQYYQGFGSRTMGTSISVQW